MNVKKHYDLVVIGAGPGGMAAAVSAKLCGIKNILIIERHNYLGGILPQCIHDGFGLYLYKKSLTGPEYAEKWADDLKALDIDIYLTTTALKIFEIKEDTDSVKKKWGISYINNIDGINQVSAKAVIISTGCREKTLAQLHIPGSRPSGIYTAGSAQYMMNIQNYLPGKSAVILGSGDIGLIMARRMTLEGINVKLILGQNSTGLVRNHVQCVEDFNIPMQYGKTVVSVHGYKRLKGVTIAPINENGEITLNEKEYVPCDTLLIAAGLIPELEICKDSSLISDSSEKLDLDENLCIGKEGIFACGNCVKVHDLADSVSLEGQRAGIEASEWILSDFTISNDLSRQLKIEITEPKGINQLNKNLQDKEKQITCILCPTGCQISICKTSSSGDSYEITDFGCHKGEAFALEEYTNPQRTVTTSVKLNGGIRPLLPVRTDKPISKKLIPEVIAIARKFSCDAPISPGKVLIKNIAGSDADLISSAHISKAKTEERS
ncbi:FAD-dependent oxidoreductase [Anaerovorax odorimutans]|uniref:FAD-dependent oxidoreductase n=1 Tax=Anaerovorax odorimutans TaxID=109327 RepID=UPI0003F74DF3|nr:FAD-dependent oxidoreductase [Anaerovorax odorimutans]